MKINGAKLRAARAAANMTSAELGAVIGVSGQAICHHETAESPTRLPDPLVAILAKRLKVKVSDLAAI